MLKPTELLEHIKGIAGRNLTVSMRQIFKSRGIDPTLEENRKDTWNVAQTCATLVREGYLELHTGTGERVYTVR